MPGMISAHVLVFNKKSERMDSQSRLSGLPYQTLRVRVANDRVLGFRVIVILVQLWGKYMIIE